MTGLNADFDPTPILTIQAARLEPVNPTAVFATGQDLDWLFSTALFLPPSPLSFSAILPMPLTIGAGGFCKRQGSGLIPHDDHDMTGREPDNFSMQQTDGE